MDEDALRQAEIALTEALVDPGAWSRALDLVAAGAGARGLAVLPLQGRVPGAAASSGVEGLFEAYYREGWATQDARYGGMDKLLRTGIVADQDYIAADAMDRHPFWGDFLLKHEVKWFCGLSVRAHDDAWCLALQRTPAQGAFLPHEQATLLGLSSALSRAATLMRLLGESKLDGFGDALDHTGMASFVLGRHGEVLRFNALAQALLDGGLALQGGEIAVPGRPDLTAAIRLHVAATLWSSVAPVEAHLKSVVLPRRDQAPMRLTAHLIRGALADPFAPGRMLVTVGDMARPVVPAGSSLRDLFGLTTGEIRLVQALASGKDLQAAASALNVTYQSARSYLKTIFLKTGTQRQAQLVALVSSLRE